MELAEVDGRIATAEEERQAAQSEVEKLQERERLARQWADLQVRRTGLEQKWQQAQGVLTEAASIEKNLKRLQELKGVLPHRLTELDRAFPLLARLHGKRHELGEAREQEQAAVRLEKQVRERGDQLKKKHAALAQALTAAEQDRQQADEKATEARTLLNQAQAQLKEFLHLEGAKVCRSCGQPLTKGHFEEEKKKREAALAEAKTTFQPAE